jgi:beta-aspartyl-peptidase (threonine type)
MLAHGGAGARPMSPRQRACLQESLMAGYDLLRRGDSALAAVEVTIRLLEASGRFNAGRGSRLQLDGARRMDAAVMEGRALTAGAVAGIQEVCHPITVARLVMERTDHVLLAGDPATRFARHLRLERLPAPRLLRRRGRHPTTRSPSTRKSLALFLEMSRRDQPGRETVGAVALDLTGSVAAGASTGGIDLMLPGRVGDTPLIGCGVYADDEAGAVSMTGVGEKIIRLAVAKEIADRLAAGAGPAAAARRVLTRLVTRVQGAAGALVLVPDGRFTIRHTTPRMLAGSWDGTGKPIIEDRWR